MFEDGEREIEEKCPTSPVWWSREIEERD